MGKDQTFIAPILDGSNYSYWKAIMRILLKSKDECVWLAVVNGWKVPTTSTMVENVTNIDIKPSESWITGELESVTWNSKRLNLIQSHVTKEKFKKIATCDTSKEAWKILKVVYEGTNTVKNSKIQHLTS